MALETDKIKNILKKLKENTKVYTPLKYFKGLTTPEEVKTRYKRILKGSKEKPDFSPFKTDKSKKTKKSKYTIAFEREYPDAKSLRKKSQVTGIPYNIIKIVYDKGLAAWGTGHRVGASGQQWGYARVHSFIMLGCTAYTADKYLVKKAIKTMRKEHIDHWKARKTMCKRKEEELFT